MVLLGNSPPRRRDRLEKIVMDKNYDIIIIGSSAAVLGVVANGVICQIYLRPASVVDRKS